MKAKTFLWVLGLATVGHATVGCGGTVATPDAPASDVPATDAPVSPGSDVPATGDFTRTPELSAGGTHSFGAATSVLTPNTDYRIVFETNVGRIVIDVFEVETPVAANSFVFLARHHFFDGIAFHRVIEDFMAQSGDPYTLAADRSRWGYGGAGYEYAVESVPEHAFDHAGVVATANAGPTTNSSQFFITFVATGLSASDYTIFGDVVEGLDVLPLITRGEPPAEPTIIEEAYVVERAR